jgi:hypothetical protein
LKLPKRLDLHHILRTPGGNITLCQTTAKIVTKNKITNIEGKIIFSLHPKVDIQFKASEPINDFGTQFLLLDETTSLTIEKYPDAEWMIYSSNPVSAYLINKISQTTNNQVEYLKFFIVNFPDILGGSYVTHNNTVTLSRLNLKPKNWRITLDTIFTEKKVKEWLRKSNGFAVTQIGMIEKKDNTLFDIKDGLDVLRELENFLGFAHGNWTPIILIEGYIGDNRVFFEWKSPPKFNKWDNRQNWLDEHHAQDMLDEGLTKYLVLNSKPQWSNVLSRAIYFYVLSNNIKYVEGSLIIAQTALELLAWNYLVVQEKALSKTTYRTTKASDKYQMMLNKLNIPLEIPNKFEEFITWAKQNNLDNGVQAVTKIRNHFVHPENNTNIQTPNGEVIYYARELALWYIELIILRLCDYNGVYSNRLNIGWVGQVEDVPWKLK